MYWESLGKYYEKDFDKLRNDYQNQIPRQRPNPTPLMGGGYPKDVHLVSPSTCSCLVCGEKAPSGDERNNWIGAHQSWYHKLHRVIVRFFLV